VLSSETREGIREEEKRESEWRADVRRKGKRCKRTSIDRGGARHGYMPPLSSVIFVDQ